MINGKKAGESDNVTPDLTEWEKENGTTLMLNNEEDTIKAALDKGWVPTDKSILGDLDEDPDLDEDEEDEDPDLDEA